MLTPRLGILFCASATLVPVSPPPTPQGPLRKPVIDLRLAAERFAVARPLVVAAVGEGAMGFTDLNGDGDANDIVIEVVDVEQGTVENLGLAAFAATTDGRLVAFAVHESSQGLDLNGDGDFGDAVLHVNDHRTGVTTNLGVAVSTLTPPRIDGERVFFLADEAGQGATDLNGDGDSLDAVLHVLDVTTGRVRNAALAIVEDPFLFDPRVPARGGTAIVAVSEAGQGARDLNGDGDAEDSVVFLFDARTGVTTDLRVAESFGLAFSGGIVPIRVWETAQSEDLNGDGDEEDYVMHVLDPATGSIENTGLAAYTLGVTEDGRFLAIDTSEAMQGGTDLNGDGDAADFVPQLVDRADGSVTNLGLAAFYPRFLETREAAAPRGPAAPRGRPGDEPSLVLMVDVFEDQQGATDLNGDGDAVDAVLVAIDLSSGVVTSTGLATRDSTGGFPGDPSAGTLLAFRASEPDSGGRDLNGDGDALDVVVHLYDARTGRILDTGLATFCCDVNLLGAFLDVHDHWVVLPVNESAQGGRDLNGDGDALDDVLHVYDARRKRAFDLGLAVDRWLVGRDGGLFVFPVREQAQGGLDLNGDGDAFDTVLHVLDLER